MNENQVDIMMYLFGSGDIGDYLYGFSEADIGPLIEKGWIISENQSTYKPYFINREKMLDLFQGIQEL